MKKTWGSIVLVFVLALLLAVPGVKASAAGGVEITETNFPSQAFRE